MHNNIILISYENSSDVMFEDPITEPMSQIPELPSTPPSEELPSEMEYVTGKSFISFGIMLAAIIILSFIFLMIKKRKKNQQDDDDDNLNQLPDEIKEVKETNQQKEAEDSVPQPRPLKPKIKNENFNKLNTPNNIKLCIRKFLEKTK